MPDEALSADELDLLAAELALGVLEGEERVRALRLQLSDRSFRVAVAAWQDRLVPMLAHLPDAEPGPALWTRIESQIEDRAPDGIVRRLRAWRTGALSASAVAAALALALLFAPPDAPQPVPPRPAAQPVAVAQLLDKSGQALLVVRVNVATGNLRVRSLDLPDGAGEPELWVIPAGGVPHSLGLIGRNGTSDIAADARTRDYLRPGSVIAVTYEPADGAPHSAPTGDILGTAPLSVL
ncbi:anti-sigma factor [Sphingomonas sp. M1-B02]|uniref:anti-sigma factor n=1 Tax=Sphingomonas sp. M1-B02 TaxID=3114300 RepID=UPI002240CE17|nr:anti-sigma factor [Sphingomonas sp. S6-11]UZK67677.1 anti-sigma factor [Sphingomonas sp. S6-11]